MAVELLEASPMKTLYRSHGYCTHCGRGDKPLTTLVPTRAGRVRHLCPSCYAAIAEVAWIIFDGPARRPIEQPPAWTVIA